MRCNTTMIRSRQLSKSGDLLVVSACLTALIYLFCK